MKRFLTAQATAVALLLLVGAGGAQAGMIPPDQVQWSYDFTSGSPQVFANGTTSSGVSFTNEQATPAIGNTGVVATQLKVFSTAPDSSKDMISGSNGNYSLTMNIGTSAGGSLQTGSLTFTGTLAGTMSSNSAAITNTVTGPTTQMLTLGNYVFTVTLDGYSHPGPPSASDQGSISASVTVTTPTVGSIDSPEPSAMLLSGIGLMGALGAAWRKRRLARSL
jgi:hypothetical protein